MIQFSLPNDFQHAAKEAVKVGGERFVFGDGLLNGLFGCRPDDPSRQST